jgi:hypothetical protein
MDWRLEQALNATAELMVFAGHAPMLGTKQAAILQKAAEEAFVLLAQANEDLWAEGRDSELFLERWRAHHAHS